MRARRHPPEPAQQPGDELILLWLGQFSKGGAWPAQLHEQGAALGVCFKQSNRTIATPESKPVDFMIRLHVGHTEFQHGRRAIPPGDACHPGTGSTGWVKPLADRKRPPRRELCDCLWQSRQPGSLVRLKHVGYCPRRNLAVVMTWPVWRWVCSAAWKRRPRTVLGRRALPTSLASMRVDGGIPLRV